MIFRKLKVLSDDEVVKIVEGAFRILRTTGCRFEDEKCMDELESAGCDVDRATMVVKFSEDVIFDALDNVPSVTPPDDLPKVRVASANKGMILDCKTKKMRPGTTEDARNVIKLCNSLDNITLASAGIVSSDVPVQAVEVFNIGLLMKYSEKLFNQWIYETENVPVVMEMAEVITGGSEELRGSKFLSYMLNSVSPLRFPPKQLAISRMYAERDLPIAVASMTQAGSVSPATPAGCLVLCAAELLAGLVWVRSLRTKTEVALGALTQVMQMRTGRQLYASPEQTLMFLGAHQIIRYFGYCSGNTSFETDSCDFDMQNGWEKALSGVMCWAAGCDMFGQAGFLFDGFSMEQLVLDNEALGMLSKVGEGVLVNDDTLALDVIKSVGPGGNFLGEKHTMAHARDAWRPSIFQRVSFEHWAKSGGMRIIAHAHDKVNEILSSKELSLQIPEDQAKAIDEIVARRVAAVAEKGAC
ncbi:MAG: Trimethylamine methyltransferase (MTTB) [bacterium ADurb.Bin236]|nr:MAG: Trimethylamine methyltransferase (MTTB) [bacterium ADurb.Bin236]HOY64122.1 trimethylamine methyltransferase family protein [bacterium]HPN94694.1 trimethylamine methyltransferase family protein [bacterium]